MPNFFQVKIFLELKTTYSCQLGCGASHIIFDSIYFDFTKLFHIILWSCAIIKVY